MNLKQTIEAIKTNLDFIQNDELLAQQYEPLREWLADSIALDGTDEHTFISKLLIKYNISEDDRDAFIDYILDWGEFKPCFIDPFSTPFHGLYFGDICEHEIQLPTTSYNRSLATVFDDLTVNDHGYAYLADDRHIYFELQDESEIINDFINQL